MTKGLIGARRALPGALIAALVGALVLLGAPSATYGAPPRQHRGAPHRHYYRYGYAGPGWYDDCGYYGPNGYDSYYDSPDACDWQYGPQGQSLRADLSGDQEVQGPGAPNAFGTANLFADPANGRLCYRLGYDGINRPSIAPIHPGGPGQNRQPRLDLPV